MQELTEEQKNFVSANWDKMSLPELVRKTFNDPTLDGRCLEGRIIKVFLGSRKVRTSRYSHVDAIELTSDQKELIESNPTLRPIEAARIIFPDIADLHPLGRYVKAVEKYRQTLGPLHEDDTSGLEYKSPTQLSQIVKKVNDFAGKEYDLATMSTLQKRNMESLRNFMRSPRFLQMINSYYSQKSRNVFEQEFIRAVYDKPDLTPDELNLYVNLCHNYVSMITHNRHKDLLDARYEDTLNDPESKLSTTLSEMIKAKADELNKCDKRQSELISDLNGKRSVRIKEQKGNSASIANLIEWWKEEEERIKALAWAEKENAEAADEIDRLETLSEMKARVLGISRSEMLHG